jgi:hypothetical protein
MKQLSKTQVTVRLRKAEDRKEWYVYLESYPVFIAGKNKPQRSRSISIELFTRLNGIKKNKQN